MLKDNLPAFIGYLAECSKNENAVFTALFNKMPYRTSDLSLAINKSNYESILNTYENIKNKFTYLKTFHIETEEYELKSGLKTIINSHMLYGTKEENGHLCTFLLSIGGLDYEDLESSHNTSDSHLTVILAESAYNLDKAIETDYKSNLYNYLYDYCHQIYNENINKEKNKVQVLTFNKNGYYESTYVFINSPPYLKTIDKELNYCI
jgi:hypothetical protein